MSDTVSERPETASSAGALLRQAREEAGLHAAALAGALKVPQRQIEALEEDRIELLPDVVYARALAASVCRSLRIDPQPVLAKLPKMGESRLGKNEPINVPFRAPGDAARGGWHALLSRPAVVGALALLVGAVVLLLLPLIPNRTAEPVVQPTVGESPAPPSLQAGPAPAPTGMVTEAVPSPTLPAQPVDTPSPTAPPAGATPAAPATPSAAEAQPADAAAAPVIEFRARQPSWVQVTDPRGAVYLRRMLAAGETVGVSGATPLLVVIGSANSTQVQVRGRPFDLAPHVRDNVARFEVR